jgi:hypothetical protein
MSSDTLPERVRPLGDSTSRGLWWRGRARSLGSRPATPPGGYRYPDEARYLHAR